MKYTRNLSAPATAYPLNREEMSDVTEISHALDLMAKRIGKANTTLIDIQGDAGLRPYKATIQQAWVKSLVKDVQRYSLAPFNCWLLRVFTIIYMAGMVK